LREGKAIGSEEGKGLGSGLCCDQMKEFRGHIAHYRNFYIKVGSSALK
jgi:hypothetical protein